MLGYPLLTLPVVFGIGPPCHGAAVQHRVEPRIDTVAFEPKFEPKMAQRPASMYSGTWDARLIVAPTRELSCSYSGRRVTIG